jgi:CheY-like chemotaxis protein
LLADEGAAAGHTLWQFPFRASPAGRARTWASVWLGKGGADTTKGIQPPMATVLVADDEPDLRIILARILARAGHTITTAADGRAALDQARAEHPDLIVTDHDMPHMTGLELCAAIHNDPDLRRTPIVILSGRLLPGDPHIADTRLAAMLTKPFTSRDLIATIQNILDNPGAGFSAATSCTPARSGRHQPEH